MSLFISSLNSGSNGNCYYVGNANEAVLVDVGISCREVEKRMAKLGLSLQKVKAVFISHEHTDHVSGVDSLVKKYGFPVYISAPTFFQSNLKISNAQVIPFRPDLRIGVGELSITPFTKCHDASDPHSFTISYEGVNVGVFTDIGRVCNNLVYYFQQCHAAFLESNYDPEMLMTGRYPAFLKNRIRGGSGHLSNTEALSLYRGHRPSCMSHLILSHLSKENNCPKLVADIFERENSGTRVIVASRYEQTPVYEIHAGIFSVPSAPVPMPATPPARPKQLQLSLF